jgi:hypothetical protein
MKYKIGDKVRVREDLVVDKTYDSVYFVENMAYWRGRVVTISDIIDNYYYKIKEDEADKKGFRYSWTDEMFEDVPENNAGEIKARTVDVGYYLKFCGHRVIGNVYQGVDNGKLFFTTVDGLNQYTLPKDVIEWVVPHEG